MFKKILGKLVGSGAAPAPQEVSAPTQAKPGPVPQQHEEQLSPAMRALLQTIREKSAQDPLIGAKLGAKEIFQRLLDGMRDARGVHIESILCALGALAGYACQASLRAQALAKGMPETAAFQTVQTKDGKQYFFGDPLNHALAEDQYSVWGLVAGAAQHIGAQELPDLGEVFQHTAQAVGSDQFGIPRIPEGHSPGDLPVNYLKILWLMHLPTVKLFCPAPVEWPVLYALAIQEVIYAGKAAIDPRLAVSIVMESAVPMSKIDLAHA